jgi:hypothetical protein
MLCNTLVSVAQCSSALRPVVGSRVIFKDAQTFEAWGGTSNFPGTDAETVFEVMYCETLLAAVRPVGSNAVPFLARIGYLMLIVASTNPDHRTTQTPSVHTPEVAAEQPDGLYFVALLDDDKAARRKGSSHKATSQALPHEQPVMFSNRAQAVRVAETMSMKHEKKFGVFGMIAETEPVVVKEVSAKTTACRV